MIQDWITQVWVQYTGKKIDATQDHWLLGPMGRNSAGKIDFEHQIHITATSDYQTIGLVQNIEHILNKSCDVGLLHSNIRVFYEATSLFQLFIKTKWRPSFQPMGWLIQKLFSKRLQQLHLPIGSNQSASVISQLTAVTAQPFNDDYTLWQRHLSLQKETLFSGLYGHTVLPNNTKVIKVVFPLPNGNATVLLKASITKDGAWMLQSDGKKFGDAGFYFTMKKDDKYYAKFVPAMKEQLQLRSVGDKELLAQHDFSFWGITFLSMEYTILRKD